MSKTIYLITVLILYCSNIQGQNIKEYIFENTNNIESIDPSDTNFTDLEPLKQAIGEASVVFLGEQDHGDAPCFMAKTRIIKYLHEKLYFDILVFESGFYALNTAWENGPDLDKINRCIYPIWSYCEQNKPLFNYIQSQSKLDNPLIIQGFDCRHSPGNRNSYLNDFDSIIKKIGIQYYNSNFNDFKPTLTEVINKEYKSLATKENQEKFYNHLDTINLLFQQSTIENKDFWIQEIRSLKGHAANAWGKSNDANTNDKNIRDIQMGDNLLWLIRHKYPAKKIIVWAANFHIAKKLDKIEEWNKNEILNYVSAGKIVADSINKQIYVIGFDSYSGKAGRITIPHKNKIRPPKGECFENWMLETGFSYAFTDFKKFNGHESFMMKGLGHYPVTAPWHEMFDGIFYIKNMYPCDKIVVQPASYGQKEEVQ